MIVCAKEETVCLPAEVWSEIDASCKVPVSVESVRIGCSPITREVIELLRRRK